MIVVSNTSPIINLAAVGHLNLLQQLYGNIVIPQAVYREVAVIGAGQPGARAVQMLDWFSVQSVSDQSLLIALRMMLDAGEAEAIALAVSLQADWLLIDERKGRWIASGMGIRYIGILGMLVQAKREGYISAVAPVLEALVYKAGFWIGETLYARVLREVGELNPNSESELRTEKCDENL